MPPRGRGWEVQLEELHRRYRRDRKACVLRASQPTKHLETLTGGRFVAVYAGDGPPDFGGTVAPQGRGVKFDAKDCQGTRFPLAQIEEHQAKDLESTHLCGGLAFVALRLQGAAYVLPWEELGRRYWAWKEEGGAASLKPEPWWKAFDVVGEGWLACVT